MTTLVLEADPSADDILFDTHMFAVKRDDGRALSIPLTSYPRLQLVCRRSSAQSPRLIFGKWSSSGA